MPSDTAVLNLTLQTKEVDLFVQKRGSGVDQVWFTKHIKIRHGNRMLPRLSL